MRQVLRAGARGRPRGMGWGRRREGGSGWGIHADPWLIHVSVWHKPLQYCKVISLQLIKINEKKKKKKASQWKRKRHFLKPKLFIFCSFQNRKRNINKLSYLSNGRELRERKRVIISLPYQNIYYIESITQKQ